MTQKLVGHVPDVDGFRMPGEYEPHKGCILIWPSRPGSWIYGAKAAREAFRNVIAAIAASETVYLAAGEDCVQSACEKLFGGDGYSNAVFDVTKQVYLCREDAIREDWQKNVIIFICETDDAWARDVAPTFVKNRETVRGINWEFNAWGGKVDGLYGSWKLDNAFAAYFSEKFGYDYYDMTPFVLEGGSIHSDGDGTVMVTEACLLSAGRNPQMSKASIEEMLKHCLGADKVLWLPRGIYQDETNEHVDNVCAFLAPGEVVLAWTDNESDPQYALSKQCLDYLQRERDAKGRELIIHKLPIPDVPVCITEDELDGYTFEEGEDEREVGERLAASYVNFYFSNDAVVMPVFGGANEESDARAVSLMQQWNPKRKVIPVYARDILVGGGNIHCITQQIPR